MNSRNDNYLLPFRNSILRLFAGSEGMVFVGQLWCSFLLSLLPAVGALQSTSLSANARTIWSRRALGA